MSASGLTKIDIPAITSFEEVLRELNLLEKLLPHSELSRFGVFNTAYMIVTKAIEAAAKANYFRKPVFIEKFTVCFASYYFQAMNDILSESPDLPVAWAKMRAAAQNNSTPVFIILLLGANAHINHDLPLAMAKFISNDKDYSLHDARKVDSLLMKSGKQIIPTFDESSKFLNNMKRRLQILYYRPVMYTILFWRIIAWRNFRAILRGDERSDNHVSRSIKIADRLLRIGSVLGR